MSKNISDTVAEFNERVSQILRFVFLQSVLGSNDLSFAEYWCLPLSPLLEDAFSVSLCISNGEPFRAWYLAKAFLRFRLSLCIRAVRHRLQIKLVFSLWLRRTLWLATQVGAAHRFRFSHIGHGFHNWGSLYAENLAYPNIYLQRNVWRSYYGVGKACRQFGK